MKALILKEIIWFFIAVLMSIPLSFLFLSFLSLTSQEPAMNRVEKIFTVQLFVIGCVIMFVCTYTVRIVVKGIKMLLGNGGGVNP
jgi:hypothetical protein